MVISDVPETTGPRHVSFHFWVPRLDGNPKVGDPQDALSMRQYPVTWP